MWLPHFFAPRSPTSPQCSHHIPLRRKVATLQANDLDQNQKANR